MSENVSYYRPVELNQFQLYVEAHGLLEDLSHDTFPTRLSAWNNGNLDLLEDATHYGFVYSGTLRIEVCGRTMELGPGMYFSQAGAGRICGSGRGVVISRYDHLGFFQVGGPIESKGRLQYIDGCTDSLLIPPILKGDPCFNLLHFPPAINQTPHTHPSMRVGMISSGHGECVTPGKIIPLNAGDVFIIPAEALHSFHTGAESMNVVAYHPDSDFGPTHEFHPMINRTIVEGVSASFLDEIRTKSLED